MPTPDTVYLYHAQSEFSKVVAEHQDIELLPHQKLTADAIGKIDAVINNGDADIIAKAAELRTSHDRYKAPLKADEIKEIGRESLKMLLEVNMFHHDVLQGDKANAHTADTQNPINDQLKEVRRLVLKATTNHLKQTQKMDENSAYHYATAIEIAADNLTKQLIPSSNFSESSFTVHAQDNEYRASLAKDKLLVGAIRPTTQQATGMSI